MTCPYITKSGDKGKTSIIGERIEKTSDLIKFLGALDEINSYIGLSISYLYEKKNDNFDNSSNFDSDKVKLNKTDGSNFEYIVKSLLNIQNQLLNIGGYMSGGNIEITDQYYIYIEELSSKLFQRLQNANNFVLPGGSLIASYFHITRCIIRRSETIFWNLGKKNENIAKYINRLSDLFFVLGRLYGQDNEKLWKVGNINYE